MKTIFVIAALSLVSIAYAASVKVTSFNMIRVDNSPFFPLAELCGTVEGATASPTFVKVLVDPKTNKPGSYNTVAGADGKFCLTLVTYRGSAEVSVINDSGSVSAKAQ